MKLFIAGFLIWVICIALWQLNNLPIVCWSNTKSECVKVFISGQECDCSVINLETDKYEKVWVK